MRYTIKPSFNYFRSIAAFFIFTFIFAGVLTIQPGRSYAQVGCEIGIVKSASPSDGTIFTFVATGANEDGFELADGEGKGLVILGNNTADVVEVAQDGWMLQDVECETENVIATSIENGIELSCPANGGAASCTFFNIFQPQVPTLSEWGMISAAVGLGLVGVFFAVKRLRASKQSDAIG